MLHRVAGVELRQGLGSVGGQGHPQALKQVATRHGGTQAGLCRQGSQGRGPRQGSELGRTTQEGEGPPHSVEKLPGHPERDRDQ